MESKTKWLDQIRYVLRLKHRRISTEDAYVPWVKRFILFGKLSAHRDRRDSAVIGVPEVWRYDGQQMVIYRLEDGTYRVSDTSVVLPGITTQELVHFVLLSTTMPRHAWFAAIQSRVHQR